MREVVGIALTSIIGLIAAFFILLYSLSSVMRKVARGFFDAIAAEDYSKAYHFLSDKLKNDVREDDFEEYLERRYMTDVADYRGNDFNVAANGSNGEFKTHLILNSEGVVPVTLELIKLKGK